MEEKNYTEDLNVSNSENCSEPEEALDKNVRLMSPTRMVVRRFFRSKLSIAGLVMIVSLFLFCWIGPLVYNVWGQAESYTTGKIEYTQHAVTYEKDGKRLEPDSLVLGVHIPRTLTPFSQENCDESFARAKAFFAGRLGDAPLAFVCNSWLLYPENERILHEKSNIRKFMARFDITEHTDVEDYDELWSVFDMEYTGNIEDFPEDTFLRRAYKEHLRHGGKTGRGFGVFFAQ